MLRSPPFLLLLDECHEQASSIRDSSGTSGTSDAHPHSGMSPRT